MWFVELYFLAHLTLKCYLYILSKVIHWINLITYKSIKTFFYAYLGMCFIELYLLIYSLNFFKKNLIHFKIPLMSKFKLDIHLKIEIK